MKKYILLFALLLLISGAMYAQVPEVVTAEVTEFGTTTAICGGLITNDGGSVILAYGISYSTVPDFEGAFGTLVSGDNMNDNSFTVSLTDLDPGMDYYVRAYATNGAGIGYGDIVTFQTDSIVSPSVTTTVTELGTTTATCGGIITNDGGSVILAYGVSYSTVPDFEGAFGTLVSGDNMNNNSFTVSLTDLDPGMDYYVRAYATNGAGIGYGNIVTFQTDSIVSPSVTTIVTEIGATTATCGGIITNDGGGTILSYGVSYSTIDGFEGPSGTLISGNNLNNNSFTVNLVNLDSGTSYYVRAYAMNEDGWTYAEQLSFKTDCTISVSAAPIEGGTVSGAGDYSYGAICTLTAIPDTVSGYTFVNWTKNESQVSTNTIYTFSVEESADFVAHFDLNSYEISASASPSCGGIVNGAGIYNHGQSCALTAVAHEGYIFTNWTENDSVVCTEEEYTFNVICDRDLKANFTQDNYIITTEVSPDNAGLVTISSSDTYHYGDTITLTAYPYPGYTFSHWHDGITDNPRTITVTEDATYIAYFSEIPVTYYNITTDVTPVGSGVVTGGGTYEIGTIVELAATANEGYTFVQWQDGIADNPREVIVNSDTTFVAVFEEVSCVGDVKEIVRKYHTEGNDSYVLILVYPNSDDDQEDENDFTYQWLYSKEEQGVYDSLTEGTWNKQYYYKGKGNRIEDGYYKVRICKQGCPVSAETKPCLVTNNSKLKIYPNPSRRGNNMVVVKDCEGPALLAIYSTDGRLLHTQTVTDNQAAIGISLPSGVYVAYLTDGNGYSKVGKLIIQ